LLIAHTKENFASTGKRPHGSTLGMQLHALTDWLSGHILGVTIKQYLPPVGKNSKVIDEIANKFILELYSTNSMTTALVSGVSQLLFLREFSRC